MDIIPYDFSGRMIRIVMDDKGQPWWVAADVCLALGIANPRDAVSRLESDEKSTVGITDGGPERNIINEPGLYRLLSRSNKKRARKFQRWVFHDVLPSIRKTGMYNMQELTRLQILEMAIDSEKKRMLLEAENKQLKPKAEIYDQVCASKGIICISDCAKILKIPPHAFCRRLRDDGFCFDRRGQIMPVEEYMKRGWFEVKLVQSRDGSPTTYRQTFITPLGVNKFRAIYNFKRQQISVFA